MAGPFPASTVEAVGACTRAIAGPRAVGKSRSPAGALGCRDRRRPARVRRSTRDQAAISRRARRSGASAGREARGGCVRRPRGRAARRARRPLAGRRREEPAGASGRGERRAALARVRSLQRPARSRTARTRWRPPSGPPCPHRLLDELGGLGGALEDQPRFAAAAAAWARRPLRTSRTIEEPNDAWKRVELRTRTRRAAASRPRRPRRNAGSAQEGTADRAGPGDRDGRRRERGPRRARVIPATGLHDRPRPRRQRRGPGQPRGARAVPGEARRRADVGPVAGRPPGEAAAARPHGAPGSRVALRSGRRACSTGRAWPGSSPAAAAPARSSRKASRRFRAPS